MHVSAFGLHDNTTWYWINTTYDETLGYAVMKVSLFVLLQLMMAMFCLCSKHVRLEIIHKAYNYA